MRLTALAVLALVSSFTLVGCGDDSGDVSLKKEKTTTTEAESGGSDEKDDKDKEKDKDKDVDDADRDLFIESILSADAPLDEDQAGCLADEALPQLTDEGFDTITSDSSFDLSDLSDDDAEIFIAGLDECLPIDGLATDFTDAMTTEIGVTLDDDEAECTAEEIADGYSGSGEFLRDMGQADPEDAAALVFDALGNCITDDTAIAIFTSAIGENLPADVAECISTEIVGQLGAAESLDLFIQAGQGSTTDLEALTADAAVVCDPSGTYSEDEIEIPTIGGGLGGQ